ncbi:MAG: Rho termination factor N-terminal domain-containing protein [Spirochaetes bacterium]|nr:Rho termination factor N-terminal domain-containing protein [Spirochaetota bacterium]
MKFQFLVDIGGAPYISASTIMDLSPEEVEKYRGRNDNHLQPMDKEAAEYLAGEPTAEATDEGEPPKEPTRDELIETAKKLEIKGASQMNKGDLIAAIAAAKA